MQIREHIEDKGILFWTWPIAIPLALVFLVIAGCLYLFIWIGARLWDFMDYLIDLEK